ncbi:1-aminocyclopropane-1-carboxylate deaminase [Calothrix sp. NIES-4101]|nr:1-aminocyclopropane-1-carboxylate deaminase [Calothrix sp. NIES-4101]
MTSFFAVPPLQEINSAIAHQNNVQLYVLRLDLIHPFVNGNKWFKLKYNLEAAKAQNLTKLLTFGGAYSNHIYATAATGNLFGLQTIGVIRGEQTLPLNPTLDFAVSQGMQLVYLDRQTYRTKQTAELQASLKNRFGDFFMIPEGGCNLNGVRGCTEIISNSASLIKDDFDMICLACGTGTTLAGVALSLRPKQLLIGFPVLKGGEFLKPEIETLLAEYLSSDLPIPGDKNISWELIHDYHFGGYAKVNEELVTFQKEFEKLYKIPLDYVYTAKMFYGVMDLIQQRYFNNCRILLIHTGGLQGNLGIEKRLKKRLK